MATVTYMAKCAKCGCKITTQGKMVGGDSNCSHDFKPLQVVFPTDAERRWIDLIDENKGESVRHYKTFEDDLKTIGQRKTKALEEIAAKVQSLKRLLDSRQEELETEVMEQFKLRSSKMKENMTALQQHQQLNDDAKESSQDLLTGDKPKNEREKIIVGQCEKIINGTPQLKFVDTELRFEFDSLSIIETKIAHFGKLHYKPLSSGKPCVFESNRAAAQIPSSGPKQVTLPTVELKKSAFDDKAKRLQLAFKLSPKKESIEGHILDNLIVEVLCCEDKDDDEKATESPPIHRQSVKFGDCTLNERGRYELTVDHEFRPGLTINSKLRPIFKSPDPTKYIDGEGDWCKEQPFDLPAKAAPLVFKLNLNGQQETLSVDPEHGLYYEMFESAFLKTFGRTLGPGDKLLLMSSDGVLNEKSDLKKYVSSNDAIILGNIQPPLGSANPVGSLDDFSIGSPTPSTTSITSPAPSVEPGSTPRKKQKLSLLASYGAQKGWVILKSNPKKQVNDFTFKTLEEKVVKKFGKRGLAGQFTVTLDGHGLIQTDQDVANLQGYVPTDGEEHICITVQNQT